MHENLAVYFIHGKSAPGKVPLTLEEALAKGVVKVRETGNVNQLEIENLGNDEVFVQSGDIVKGGQQDRTLMVSLVLPPKSGRVPIASFCVEQGRWSARGREDVKNFSTASAAVPSREMKLAMKAPMPAAPPADADPARRGRTIDLCRRDQRSASSRSGTACARRRRKLTGNIGAPVSSAQSASSLQLALENEKLIDAQQAYIKALKAAGESDDDIVGYVFAVNGKLNSADVYPSNGAVPQDVGASSSTASAIEAIGHKDEPRDDAPSIDAVTAFLAAARTRQGEREAAQCRRAARHPRRRQGLSVRDRARGSPARRRLGAPELSGEVDQRRSSHFLR